MDERERKKIGQENLEWGHEAEGIAADYYMTRGYVVRERNWHRGQLEIDLILEKDRTIVFVEVKARKSGSLQEAVMAVDAKKRRNTIKAADTYMQQFEKLYEFRFDVFGITGDKENYKITLFEDAYIPDVNDGKGRW